MTTVKQEERQSAFEHALNAIPSIKLAPGHCIVHTVAPDENHGGVILLDDSEVQYKLTQAYCLATSGYRIEAGGHKIEYPIKFGALLLLTNTPQFYGHEALKSEKSRVFIARLQDVTGWDESKRDPLLPKAH